MIRNTFLAALVLPLLLLVSCEKKVTLDNYSILKEGMTQAEVETILGKGELQVNSGASISGAGVLGGATQNSLDTYTWREGTKEISVTFKDGKVASFSNGGL